MLDHEGIREDLADYAASRLDAARADTIERHLMDCDDCRGAVSFMKGLSEAIDEAGEALFEPHPDVADLRRYAIGEATDDADRMAKHLKVCLSCDLESAAWAVRAMETSRAPGDSVIPGPWLRRVIGPWLAAAAGLVLGIALTLLVTSRPAVAPQREGWNGPAHHLMISGAVRGSAPDVTFALTGDGGPVVLDLMPVIPGGASDADEFRLTIRSENGGALWSAAATAAEMRRTMETVGVVAFVVPSGVLSAGRNEIALAPAGADAAPIVRATVEITAP